MHVKSASLIQTDTHKHKQTNKHLIFSFTLDSTCLCYKYISTEFCEVALFY